MNEKTNKIDIWIFLAVIGLLLFSLLAVYSASSYYFYGLKKDTEFLLRNHLIKVILGIAMIFLFMKLDYNIYRRISKFLIWFAIFLLLYVLLFAAAKKNVYRWIDIGPISFQPSDFAKYALVIHISYLLMKKKEYTHLLYRGYLPVLFYILMITALVAFQPNLSTSLIIFGSSMFLLFVSPVKMKHMIITVLLMIPFIIIFVVSNEYMLKRLSKYSDHTSGMGADNQLAQAIIGLGNGGLIGVGAGNSYQKEYFLHEAYSDFIFAVVGEEYGFIGAVILILIFVMLIVRGYKVAKDINDDFGKYIAFGITTIIALYSFVNISVATGIIPTTGVPIPFVSYGGTALVINCIGIGILLNISSQRGQVKSLNEKFSKVVEV
ncbi:MAG: cell division protein FtsW [Ignavibacteria bacterium]|nr:cell division protein FtsW [Ignavibacteria bacterium]